MNLKNNEFVVSLACHNRAGIPLLFAVTNFGRLFYLSGGGWVLEVDNG